MNSRIKKALEMLKESDEDNLSLYIKVLILAGIIALIIVWTLVIYRLQRI